MPSVWVLGVAPLQTQWQHQFRQTDTGRGWVMRARSWCYKSPSWVSGYFSVSLTSEEASDFCMKRFLERWSSGALVCCWLWLDGFEWSVIQLHPSGDSLDIFVCTATREESACRGLHSSCIVSEASTTYCSHFCPVLEISPGDCAILGTHRYSAVTDTYQEPLLCQGALMSSFNTMKTYETITAIAAYFKGRTLKQREVKLLIQGHSSTGRKNSFRLQMPELHWFIGPVNISIVVGFS